MRVTVDFRELLAYVSAEPQTYANNRRPLQVGANAPHLRRTARPRGAAAARRTHAARATHAPFKDRRGATSVAPRRLREERVLHSPARI
jgi:hypothetical protein